MKKSTLLLLAIFGCVLLGAAETAAPAKPAAAPAAAVKQPAAPATPAAAVTPAAPAAAAQQPAAVQQKEEESPSIAQCFARGLCNVSTGWLELPRCIVYDNSFIPVFGLIAGIPEGAILTVCRTLSGVVDIVSFGTVGNTFHGKVFPNTVFGAKWLVEKK